MRRRARTFAAGLWLLLVACGDSQPARAPLDPARQPKTARGSHVSLSRNEPKTGPIRGEPQTSDAPQRSASSAPRMTSDELAGRFGSARALAVQHGSASYYAEKFEGRSTASGVPYEALGFTAAHRTLPFGTVLRVTRNDGGQVVYVRVTDRGPFGPRGRILDLSHAAAQTLGMLRAGVVKVRVEVVEYGPRKSRRRRR